MHLTNRTIIPIKGDSVLLFRHFFIISLNIWFPYRRVISRLYGAHLMLLDYYHCICLRKLQQQNTRKYALAISYTKVKAWNPHVWVNQMSGCWSNPSNIFPTNFFTTFLLKNKWMIVMDFFLLKGTFKTITVILITTTDCDTMFPFHFTLISPYKKNGEEG